MKQFTLGLAMSAALMSAAALVVAVLAATSFDDKGAVAASPSTTGAARSNASAPAQSSLIRACYDSKERLLRIPETADCGADTELTWNARGVPGYEIVSHAVPACTGYTTSCANASAQCPVGKVLVEGAATETQRSGGVKWIDAYVVPTGSGSAHAGHSSDFTITAYAICADGPS
jgi:hypothetical protein